METSSILKAIDDQIEQLQRARALLAGAGSSVGKRGRPAGSTTKAKKRRGSGMSAEGRRRIAEAQRRRWAALKAAKK